MEPQLFSDIPVSVEILSGPLADHWPQWQGPEIFYYRIAFKPAMKLLPRDPRRQTYNEKTDEYFREYRGPLPTPPYSFEPYCMAPDQQDVAEMIVDAINAICVLRPDS